MKEARFSEKVGIKSMAIPADINGAGLTGSRIDMGEGYKVAAVIDFASAAADATITLQQHDAATGGNSKALVISNPYFVKLSAETKFTQKEISEVSSIVDATLNGDSGQVVVEINAEDLDVNGGFTHFSANVTDPAAARVVAGLYEMHNMRSLPAYDVDL